MDKKHGQGNGNSHGGIPGSRGGDVLLYAQPLPVKPGETANIAAYMTWAGGETYTFKFVKRAQNIRRWILLE